MAIALCGISFLVWRNNLAGIFMKSLIPIGMMFCLICLVTGSLWGRPIWGVYWVWDARLTSMLILFFLYIGLYLFYNSHDNEERALKLTSVLAIIGVVNLPIIKFSVDWWNTLHQPASITKLSKPSLHSEILTPLILMFLTFLILTFVLFMVRVKTELLRKKTLSGNL
jgi:heme exporter protein C